MKCNNCVHSLKDKTGVPSCWLPRCVKESNINRFYNTQRWKALRDRVLRRDKYLCVECQRHAKNVPAKVVHHIKERTFYPELQYDMNNLVSLCLSCHNKKHSDKGDYAKG